MANKGIAVTLRLTKIAMQPDALMEAARKAKRRSQFRAGALIRTIAKSSLRRTKKSAQHGRPPRIHTRPGLKLIKFKVPEPDVVYVYTEPFGITDGINVPEVLEEGGYQRTREGGRGARVHHPFMGPAEVKARDKYPQLWSDAFD